jgi:hypothetical protein
VSVHERVYRSLLVAYPQQHRREYGEAMVQLLRDRLRDEGGGLRTSLVWIQIVADLVRTALVERMETTMNILRQAWWRAAAGLVAIAMVLLGIGNLFGGDPGPLYGKILAAATAVALAITIIGGLYFKKHNRVRSSMMIGVGVLPASVLTIMFWWPPVAAIGVLSLVVALRAFIDADRHRRMDRMAGAPA